MKLIKLWFEIAFYSYLFLFLAYIFNYHISYVNLVKSILPVLSGAHWFISCYIMLYILFPFYNKFILILSKKELNLFMLISLVLLSVWGFLPTITKVTTNGYNILWISFIYLLGSYIRINEEFFNRISWYWYLIVYLLSSLGTLLTVYFLAYFLHSGVFHAFNYNSIFIVISAVSLFCLFKKINIKNSFSNKLIFYFSPAVFGIYLIHVNMFVREKLVSISNFDYYLDKPYLMLYVISVAIAVFICCLIVSSILHKIIIYLFNNLICLIFKKNFKSDNI